MKATKIKMKAGCARSNNTTEISEVYLEGCTNPGYFTKESYVRSEPNDTPNDNLLKLPRA